MSVYIEQYHNEKHIDRLNILCQCRNQQQQLLLLLIKVSRTKSEIKFSFLHFYIYTDITKRIITQRRLLKSVIHAAREKSGSPSK